MKVLLYADHHHLPFWHAPKRSNLLFDPVALATWVVQKWSTRGHYYPDPETPSATENYMWPILCGLHVLDLPFLAHVSAPFVEGRVESLKRAWVQFSTVPDQEVEGLPICIVDGKPVVQCLWGWDNQTRSPYEFLKVREVLPEHKVPEFWTAFFMQALRDAREEQVKTVQKLEQQLEGSRRLLTLYDPLISK